MRCSYKYAPRITTRTEQLPIWRLMPIYEYQCKACGNTFEELVYTNLSKAINCPRCGNENTEKRVSVIGAISKGSSSVDACSSHCPSASSCGMAGGGGCCGM